MIISIQDKLIGDEQPCFMIAEAGVNHNGSVDTAKRLIDAAASAGADAVKFQTFSADRLALADTPLAGYQKEHITHTSDQQQMLKELELPLPAFRDLMDHCAKRGVIFLSSPFDEISADLLNDLGVAAFKVPSGELTNHSNLDHIARKGKPVILSTGMSTLGEVESALRVVENAGNDQIILLQCTSAYPADVRDVNLNAMLTLKRAFRYPVGFSDHTEGGDIALAAVALGARVVEKHLTLDRGLPGPDHQASIEPDELAAMIRSIRRVEQALGDGRKRPSRQEQENAKLVRKSICAKKDIPKGAIIEMSALILSRPGDGLPPSFLPILLGKRASQAIGAGTQISLEMIQQAG